MQWIQCQAGRHDNRTAPVPVPVPASYSGVPPVGTVFSTLCPQAEHSYVQISVLPRVNASGDIRISGARPRHSGQTMGAPREICGGARNVGIIRLVLPRSGAAMSCGTAVWARRRLLSRFFADLDTAKNAQHGCAGTSARAQICRNEARGPPLEQCRVAHTGLKERSSRVKRKRKTLARAPAQLEGALALFGGRNEVARYDKSMFVRRTGELIARAAVTGKRAQNRSAKNKTAGRS